MLTCGCRRKNESRRDERRLLGSSFVRAKAPRVTLLSLVTAALPAGTVMVGTGPSIVNSFITLAANTSSGQYPALPTETASLFTYSSAADIWGNLAQLFIQDHMENLPWDYSDVKQGKLHNCWLISAMASLCRYGSLALPQVFAAIDPPNASAPSSVTINLYNQDPKHFYQSGGTPMAQTITWDIPVLLTDPKNPAFAHSDTPGEYWPCMMEKAVAAAATRDRGDGVLDTGYDVMAGNVPAAGMSLFCPGLGANYKLLDTQPDPKALYDAWDKCLSTGITIGLSWLTDELGGVVMKNGQLGGTYGLFPGLSYLLMSLVEANGMQMALIRFPFAVNGKCQYEVATSQQGEWNGPWSDCSPEWDTPLGQAMRIATGFTGPRSDGLFWMDMADVVQYLASYNIFIPTNPSMRLVDLRPSPLKDGCLASQVPHSNYAATGSLLGYKGDTANIVCSAGYTGGGVATCVNGAFTVNPCVANSCVPSAVPNSDHQAPGSIVGVTGDIVTVTCNPGYTGGGAAKCLTSGQFSTPKCTATRR